MLTAALDLIAMIETGRLPAGAASTTSEVPEYWIKRSVTWTVESGDLGAHLTIWDDGSAEIDFVDMSMVESRAEHRQLDSATDVKLAIEAVLAWILDESLDPSDSAP